MKIFYSSIQVELTRKCNQNCLHCCRGDSQNLDLSKEVIDAFLEKNEIMGIDTLMFSGGEPTLNGEGLEYFVKRLIEKQIKVRTFILSINGLSYSDSFVRALNELNNYCKNYSSRPRKQCGVLFVSQSQFHKEAMKEVIEKFSQLPYFIPLHGMDIIDSNNILPYGNAEKNKLTINKPDLNEVLDYDNSFRIKEHNGENILIFNYQYISSNGNVLTDGCISYQMMDKYYIGNVKEKPIIEMYHGLPKMRKLIK